LTFGPVRVLSIPTPKEWKSCLFAYLELLFKCIGLSIACITAFNGTIHFTILVAHFTVVHSLLVVALVTIVCLCVSDGLKKIY